MRSNVYLSAFMGLVIGLVQAYPKGMSATKPLPVGGPFLGYTYYAGGSIGGFEGHARLIQNIQGNAESEIYIYSGDIETGDSVTATTLGDAREYSMSSWAMNYTLTDQELRYGAEGHIGAFLSASPRWSLGLEAFIQTKKTFNPSSSILISDASCSTTSLTAPLATSVGQDTDSNPNANTLLGAFTVEPYSAAYGVRVMPTVMLKPDIYMYASLGYNFQRWNLTQNGEMFRLGNLYVNDSVDTQDYVSAITTTDPNPIMKTLGGLNYGLGFMVNYDEKISFYSSVEIQRYASYEPFARGSTIASTDIANPITYQGEDSDNTTILYVGEFTNLIDAGTTTNPSRISISTITYSLGINTSLMSDF